jgi:hypothetical protein
LFAHLVRCCPYLDADCFSFAVLSQRACKGCTCGLIELEAEEAAATAPVVLSFDFNDDVPDELLAKGAFGVDKILP